MEQWLILCTMQIERVLTLSYMMQHMAKTTLIQELVCFGIQAQTALDRELIMVQKNLESLVQQFLLTILILINRKLNGYTMDHTQDIIVVMTMVEIDLVEHHHL